MYACSAVCASAVAAFLEVEITYAEYAEQEPVVLVYTSVSGRLFGSSNTLSNRLNVSSTKTVASVRRPVKFRTMLEILELKSLIADLVTSADVFPWRSTRGERWNAGTFMNRKFRAPAWYSSSTSCVYVLKICVCCAVMLVFPSLTDALMSLMPKKLVNNVLSALHCALALVAFEE